MSEHRFRQLVQLLATITTRCWLAARRSLLLMLCRLERVRKRLEARLNQHLYAGLPAREERVCLR